MKGVIRKLVLEFLYLVRRAHSYRPMMVSSSAPEIGKILIASDKLKSSASLDGATLPRIKPEDGWIKPEQPGANQDDEVTKRFHKRRAPGEDGREGWILKVISGADRGRQYLAVTNTLKIGRHCDNHVYLKDPNISRRHALIIFLGERILIRDLHSTNGTWVNDQRVVGEIELPPDAKIQIGETILELEKVLPKPLKVGSS